MAFDVLAGSDLTALAEAALTRSADAVLLLEAATDRVVHRWYDRERSRLDLCADPADEDLVSWVHPDDLPVPAAGPRLGGQHGRAPGQLRAHPPGPEARSGQPSCWCRSTMSGTCSPAASWSRSGSWIHRAWSARTGRWRRRGRRWPRRRRWVCRWSTPTGTCRSRTNGSPGWRPSPGARSRRRSSTQSMHGIEVTEDIVEADTALQLRVVPTLDAEGRSVLVVASLEDVSRVVAAEAGRARAEEQFSALFDSSPLPTALVALNGSFGRSNESFAVVTGYDVDDLSGLRFEDIVHPDDRDSDAALLAELLAGTRRNYQVEKRFVHAAGHEIWVELTVAPVWDRGGAVQHLVVHVDDITTRRSMIDMDSVDGADHLAYWATHDHVTGLPNRRYLEHHLGTTLDPGRRRTDRPVVLFIDLDDFKPVNDRFGHQFGDEVLRTTARRLRNAIREDAFVARYGGDEFVVVARLRGPAELPALTERIQAAVQVPIPIADRSVVRVGASIGVAIARAGDSAADVIGRADQAAYAAKAAGKGRTWFGSVR